MKSSEYLCWEAPRLWKLRRTATSLEDAERSEPLGYIGPEVALKAT